uniref:Uncharacterized protein n=1 Tax=Arundo donax TaxID=35708 RepID=A0A0A8YFV0_ARUDO
MNKNKELDKKKHKKKSNSPQHELSRRSWGSSPHRRSTSSAPTGAPPHGSSPSRCRTSSAPAGAHPHSSSPLAAARENRTATSLRLFRTDR